MAMNKILFLVVNLLAAFTAAAQEDSPLVFKDGNQAIRLEFENNLPYLELNKPTKMTVYADNVKREETAVVGRGISRLYNPNEDPFSLWTVTVDEKGVFDAKYKIIVQYGLDDDGARKTCTFLIPVKM
jgi:hypothetical protein